MKLDLFVCVRIGHGVRLTRHACGRRYAHLHSPASKALERVTASACMACPTGKAHAQGKRPAAWPDGEAIACAEVVPHVGLERLVWRGGGARP